MGFTTLTYPMPNNLSKAPMCYTAHVDIPVHTPVALAPYATAQCIAQTCDLTHLVISLMAYTGDDIK